MEIPFIAQFKIDSEFEGIVKQYEKNPNKAKKKLVKLIHKHEKHKQINLDHLLEMLKDWNDELYVPVDKLTILDDEPKEETPKLPDTSTMDKNQLVNYAKRIIDSNTGDTGRLEHIIRMLESGKELYKSDKDYLQSAIKNHFGI